MQNNGFNWRRRHRMLKENIDNNILIQANGYIVYKDSELASAIGDKVDLEYDGDNFSPTTTIESEGQQIDVDEWATELYVVTLLKYVYEWTITKQDIINFLNSLSKDRYTNQEINDYTDDVYESFIDFLQDDHEHDAELEAEGMMEYPDWIEANADDFDWEVADESYFLDI